MKLTGEINPTPDERILIEKFILDETGEVVFFSKDWNGLMKVVHLISAYRLAYPKQADWVCKCYVVVYQKALYREVIQFIKWLNTTKPQLKTPKRGPLYELPDEL